MSDRILVMRQGSVAGELAGTEATQERVMHLAVGGQSKVASGPAESAVRLAAGA
jgi:hypothetical protein